MTRAGSSLPVREAVAEGGLERQAAHGDGAGEFEAFGRDADSDPVGGERAARDDVGGGDIGERAGDVPRHFLREEAALDGEADARVEVGLGLHGEKLLGPRRAGEDAEGRVLEKAEDRREGGRGGDGDFGPSRDLARVGDDEGGAREVGDAAGLVHHLPFGEGHGEAGRGEVRRACGACDGGHVAHDADVGILEGDAHAGDGALSGFGTQRDGEVMRLRGDARSRPSTRARPARWGAARAPARRTSRCPCP